MSGSLQRCSGSPLPGPLEPVVLRTNQRYRQPLARTPEPALVLHWAEVQPDVRGPKPLTANWYLLKSQFGEATLPVDPQMPKIYWPLFQH